MSWSIQIGFSTNISPVCVIKALVLGPSCPKLSRQHEHGNERHSGPLSDGSQLRANSAGSNRRPSSARGSP